MQMKKRTGETFRFTPPDPPPLSGVHPAPKPSAAGTDEHGKFGALRLCPRCGTGVVAMPDQLCAACIAGWTTETEP